MEALSAVQLVPGLAGLPQPAALGVPAVASGSYSPAALGGPLLNDAPAGSPSTGSASGTSSSSGSTGSSSSAAPGPSTTGALLQPNEFLTLLVDSLKYQDPLNPTTTSDFLSQLAALSQVQTQVEIATTDQTAAANALIGKTVSGSDLSGHPLTGVVDSVSLGSGPPVLEVGSDSMSLSSLTSIGVQPSGQSGQSGQPAASSSASPAASSSASPAASSSASPAASQPATG